ncbi:MAG: InlB B-repeat-containing protein [Prevotellaceae bacterium]|jgi:rhamnogalacturonan endolyase|nr:InlB B-repeat-containing protein [Prevotellaceae bacterium]
MFFALATSAFSARQLERLDRGLVAVKSGSNVFLSWRLYATDPAGVTFNIYRSSEAQPINATSLDAAHTNYTVANVDGATYSVATLVDGVEVERSKPVGVWGSQYLNIPVEKPTGYLASNKTPYTAYSIYDGSVGDLDGDGQYEIVFFWAPDNMKDNSQGGITGNVLIDAYKLDGAKLWGAGKYIDLGSNIRAGAHYQHFLVYDFDGDGKAEIITKTAPGTTDTEGNRIGDSNDYLGNASGYVLAGPEYVSVFEGATGKLLDTKPYDPPRHPTKQDPSGNELNSIWGDTYGNRADRLMAAVAFLDGEHPSAVMTRGIYTRSVLCAWDWDGVNLTKRWLFDTRTMDNTTRQKYEGQGDHSLSVADVDGDGKDEIIYGAMTVDDDGKPLYSSGLGHGDALHVGKFIPDREGLQIFGVYEAAKESGDEVVGTTMRDARDGKVLWKRMATVDVGRGLTADIDPESPGSEAWSSASGGIFAAASTNEFGTMLSSSTSAVSMNMAIYWDGDVGRELFDGQAGPTITKVSASGSPGSRSYSKSTLITFSGASTNGGTKANPCLQADILGDWREEVILRASDNSALRVYTTVTPTVHTGAGAVPTSGIPTLMHNSTYRLAIAWQNIGYNQPPHTDYFIGYNMASAPSEAPSAPGESAVITVTLNPNGGVFADSSSTTVRTFTAIAGGYFKVPEVSKGEDEFSGWFLADGSKYEPTAIYTKDIVLTAMWSSYTLTFDGNGGTLLTTSKKVVYNTEVGNLPTPTRASFEFKSWNSQADGTGDTYTSTTKYMLEGNLTLYAQWGLLQGYTLTFDANGGEISANEGTKEVIFGAPVGLLPIPVYEGYTFMGWNTAKSGSGNTYTDTTTYGRKSNLTLYAKWLENIVYQLSFDANGGVLQNNAPLEVVYERIVGELPEPARAGYDFYGWNTKQNGTGDTYTANTVFEGDDNVTLYARWRAKTYVLRFDANGGTPVDPDSLEVTYNAPVGDMPTPLHERGVEFVGWNAEQDGGGTTYSSTTPYNVADNLTLYAQWEQGDPDPSDPDPSDPDPSNPDPSNPGTTSVVAIGSHENLKLYPNPIANGKLVISNEQLQNQKGLREKKLKIQIYTLSGGLVGEHAVAYGAKVTVVNVAHLANGIYVVKAGNMAGKIVKD